MKSNGQKKADRARKVTSRRAAELRRAAGENLSYLALENRIAFDAAAAPTVDLIAADAAPTGSTDAAALDTSAGPLSSQQIGQLAAAISTANEANGDTTDVAGAEAAESSIIVFVDGRVQDASVIAAAAPPNAEIVVLSLDRDGNEQIAEALRGRSGIDAIHIVSHGSSGVLNLGNAELTQASIAGTHADDLAIIRGSLSVDGDILIYGCDVAANAHGQAFVEALATATGADVAASLDATGHADLDGDWVLETTTGSIEATGIFAADYDGLLAPLTITPAGTGGINAAAIAQQLLGSNVTVQSAPLYGQPYQAGVFSGATGYSPSWLAFDSGVGSRPATPICRHRTRPTAIPQA